MLTHPHIPSGHKEMDRTWAGVKGRQVGGSCCTQLIGADTFRPKVALAELKGWV